jgi:hypothetical protein
MITSSCAFIGDCIALGLALINPVCQPNAVVGRSAASIAAQHVPGSFDWVVISAGSNNPNYAALARQLRTIRARVETRRAVWILPVNRRSAAIVRMVAVSFGDRTATIAVTARDRVHPRSYCTLMKAVRVQLGRHAGAAPSACHARAMAHVHHG